MCASKQICNRRQDLDPLGSGGGRTHQGLSRWPSITPRWERTSFLYVAPSSGRTSFLKLALSSKRSSSLLVWLYPRNESAAATKTIKRHKPIHSAGRVFLLRGIVCPCTSWDPFATADSSALERIRPVCVAGESVPVRIGWGLFMR